MRRARPPLGIRAGRAGGQCLWKYCTGDGGDATLSPDARRSSGPGRWDFFPPSGAPGEGRVGGVAGGGGGGQGSPRASTPTRGAGLRPPQPRPHKLFRPAPRGLVPFPPARDSRGRARAGPRGRGAVRCAASRLTGGGLGGGGRGDRGRLLGHSAFCYGRLRPRLLLFFFCSLRAGRQEDCVGCCRKGEEGEGGQRRASILNLQAQQKQIEAF